MYCSRVFLCQNMFDYGGVFQERGKQSNCFLIDLFDVFAEDY